MMNRIAFFVTAVLLCAGAFPVHATVTPFFSIGSDCNGGNSTTFAPGGPSVQVSLCVTTTTESVCGATVQLQSASSAENARFIILNRTLGSAFVNTNASSISYPISITSPSQTVDLGGTVNSAVPPAAGPNQLLATFTISPQSTATNASYQISLSGLSAVAFENANCFGSPADIAISANLTLTRSLSIATTDLNGDGKSDLLWHNQSTGEIYAYYMNGITQTGAAYVSTVPPVWRLAGTPDLNADGKPDLLWHNQTTGEVYAYYMNGISNAGAVYLFNVNPVWRLAATADFNGDGKPDILWHNQTTGEVYVYFMNGVTQTGVAYLFTVPPVWRIAGTPDLNGDGKPDILWHNQSTGEVYVYYMNGTTQIGTAFMFTVPPVWRIIGTSDLNGDGKPDLLWHNQSTGELYAYYMNGITQVSAAFVFVVNPTWAGRM